LGWAETGGAELGDCSSRDGVNDGARIVKDPTTTAEAWLAISASRSLAIALPALAAMSDLIADASVALALISD
jgi:hypothetical protein